MGIWVGRYAIVDGEVREHGPWLAERRRQQDHDVARILVLTEPVGEHSAEFCAEVASAVAELFAREALSITGGMLRALRQAHANLAEWNRRSLHEHHVSVGTTCVAVRGHEAIVGQVGPGAAYRAGADGLLRISTEGEAAAHPLGGVEAIEPRFHTVNLDTHQLLLLTGTAEQHVGPAAIGRALGAGPERALAELFVLTRNVSDMEAVLIAEIEGVEDEAEPPAGPPELAGSMELTDPTEPATEVFAAAPDPGLPPVELVDSGGASFGTGVPPQPGGRERSAGTSDRGGMPSIRRPSGGPRPSDEGGRGLRRWRPLALAAVVLALLALLAVCTVPALLEEDRGARLEGALAAAESELAVASTAQQPERRRAALDAAFTELSRARSVAAEDPRLAALEGRANTLLAALDAVIEVDELRTVAVFDGVLTAPLTPTALTIGGEWLWLLDAERGRVFALDASGVEQPVEVYRAGEQYDGAEAGAPVAITWEPAAGGSPDTASPDGAFPDSGRLLVVDSARRLFAVTRDAAPVELVIRDVQVLASVADLSVYAGNLYVLDPTGGEVWRFLPAGEGFDSERAGLLGGLDIGREHALLVDGDVFLLAPDGVRRFRLGEELAPLLQGVAPPPDSTAGIAGDGARGLVYIGDRGGRRVLVSDRDGAFVAQFRDPQFFDLRGLTLSDDGATLYVLTGDGIVAFDPGLVLAGGE